MSSLTIRVAAGLGGLAILASPALVSRFLIRPTLLTANQPSLTVSSAGPSAPEGWQVTEFVPPGTVVNPVALATDERGRLFVAESLSLGPAYVHNTDLGMTKEDDFAVRTPEQRLKFFQKARRPSDWAGERVTLHVDHKGVGRADESSVFADGFKDPDTEIAAGVLARRGTVWFTSLPNLWKLTESPPGSEKVGERKRLHTGLGLRIGWEGHSLHGLTWGPDGRLYFSLGDVGAEVTTPNGRVSNPDSGAVFRCEPDGTGLEVFAVGLRNPQELAFDEFGNLFTADNDQDPGDESRLVHVVEGGDSGWRASVMDVGESPWIREKLWRERWPGQAAYVLPPVAELPRCDGPSGFAYDPGTGLPECYRNHFFVCNFAYTNARSGVLAMAVRPEGASFKLTQQHDFVRNVVPSDLEFGPDGSVFLAAWPDGGQPGGKSRIVRMIHPEAAGKPEAVEAKALLAGDWTAATTAELVKRLGHANARVRREAQFELAGRGTGSVKALIAIVRLPGPLLARIQALWTLGQIDRQHSGILAPLADLLGDVDAEMRAQAVRVLGEAKVPMAERLAPLLADASPRVRFFAAMAVGKLRAASLIPSVAELLREAKGRDPYLRHAAGLALAGAADAAALASLATDPDPAVRTAVVLAYRKLYGPAAAGLLVDPDPLVALEAARAINDARIEEALPALAAVSLSRPLPSPFARRVVNANRVLGGAVAAGRLASVAADRTLPTEYRVLACRALEEWADPADHDFVTGVYWKLPPRPIDGVAEALAAVMPRLLAAGSDDVRLHGVRLATTYHIVTAVPELEKLVADATTSLALRTEAIDALFALAPRAALVAAGADDRGVPPLLRVRMLGIRARVTPADVAEELRRVTETGSAAEQRQAWAAIRKATDPVLDAVVWAGMDRLLAHQVEPAAELELLEAAKPRPTASDLMRRYEASLPANDRLARRHPALYGGDPTRGETIFKRGETDQSCVRCHSVRFRIAGGAVGPDLAGLASHSPRAEILESLVYPNRKIAAGYESTVLVLADGRSLTGTVTEETADRLTVRLADGQTKGVPKADVESRRTGLSAMPENVVDNLSDRDLRDLVAFLASLEQRAGLKFAVRRLHEKLPHRGIVDYYRHGVP